MKATELKLDLTDYTMSCNIQNARQHYKFIMLLGRIFPTTKPQAKHFISKGCCLDVLNGKDVQIIESLMNKHGLSGDYKYTKSKTWVRLQNTNDPKIVQFFVNFAFPKFT